MTRRTMGLAVLTTMVLCLPVSAQAMPVMESISPTSGRGGSIEIHGKGLMGATAVHVGSVSASFKMGYLLSWPDCATLLGASTKAPGHRLRGPGHDTRRYP